MHDTDNQLPAGAISSTYNGWSNRETWLANLWLDEVLINEAAEGSPITADLVKTLIDEMIYTTYVDDGLTYDLLMTAVDRINYAEIAAAYEEVTQ
jgi:hypothetical protein